MRYLTMLVLAAGAAMSTGCSALLSLDGVTEISAPNPGLAGTWMPKGDDDLVVVRIAEDGVLDIRYGGMRLTGKAFRLGEADFLDLTPKNEEAFHVPGHAIVRYWLDGDSVRWAFADSAWLRDQILVQGIRAVTVRDTLVVTGRGVAVRDVLASLGQDGRAYGEINVMARLR
jgi:hypothetical protein